MHMGSISFSPASLQAEISAIMQVDLSAKDGD